MTPLLMAGHINRIAAGKLQSRWITKTGSSLIMLARSFHHNRRRGLFLLFYNYLRYNKGKELL